MADIVPMVNNSLSLREMFILFGPCEAEEEVLHELDLVQLAYDDPEAMLEVAKALNLELGGA